MLRSEKAMQEPLFTHTLPHDLVSLSDYERYAASHLPAAVWEYISSGVADEHTLRNNSDAFARLSLYNRLLADFSQAQTRTQLGGLSLNSPLLLAPVAHQQLIHPQGERATAQGAAAAGVPMICSTLSHTRFADIAAEHDQCWFQLYWQPLHETNRLLLQRAEEHGSKAIVVTLDAPVQGLRNRIQRSGFAVPSHLREANLRDLSVAGPKPLTSQDSVIFQGYMADRPGAEDLIWLRAQTRLPLYAKGVSHPDDARILKDLGFDGLIVSNHGGRTLDTLPASIDLLPDIRSAVGPNFPLLLDGGVRRGSDIIKALALGANAVCIGRPQLWALAVGGALGVAHMLKLLQQELEMNMALCGCPTPDEIGPGVIAGRMKTTGGH